MIYFKNKNKRDISCNDRNMYAMPKKYSAFHLSVSSEDIKLKLLFHFLNNYFNNYFRCTYDTLCVTLFEIKNSLWKINIYKHFNRYLKGSLSNYIHFICNYIILYTRQVLFKFLLTWQNATLKKNFTKLNHERNNHKNKQIRFSFTELIMLCLLLFFLIFDYN